VAPPLALGSQADDGQLSCPVWPWRTPKAPSSKAHLPNPIVYDGAEREDRPPAASQKGAQCHIGHRDDAGDVEHLKLKSAQIAGVVNHHGDREALTHRCR
jgi:hypothetical protein